jgi:hypothetical protein
LPAVGGQAATLSIAAGAPAGLTINATEQVGAPANAPAPSSHERRAQSIAGAVPFFYVAFTISGGTLSVGSLAGESVTQTSSLPTTAAYYAEFDDITSAPGTKLATCGPATLTGALVQITNSAIAHGCSGTAGTSNLVAGHSYLLQFYYIPAGSATPTPPAPTSTTTMEPIVPSPPSQNGQTLTVTNAGWTTTVALGGYTPNQNATVTLTQSSSLPTGITASMLPAGASVLQSLTLTSTVTVTGTNTNCSNCFYQTANGLITIPSATAAALAGETVYAEECVGTTCDPNSYDIIALSLTGTTLAFPPNSFQDFTGPGTTPTSFVIFAQLTPAPAPSASATASATIGATLAFPAAGPYGATFNFSPPPSPAGVSANLTGADYAPAVAVPTNPPNNQPSPAAGSSATVVAAWTFKPASAVTVGSPLQTITGLPIPPFGKQYYTYFADLTSGASFGYGNGGSFNGVTGTLTFPAPGNTTPLTTDTYLYEIVAF